MGYETSTSEKKIEWTVRYFVDQKLMMLVRNVFDESSYNIIYYTILNFVTPFGVVLFCSSFSTLIQKEFSLIRISIAGQTVTGNFPLERFHDDQHWIIVNPVLELSH